MIQFHATTICAVKRGDDVCIGGDGQVTMGETAIMKNGAKKVKKIYKKFNYNGICGIRCRCFFPHREIRGQAGGTQRQSEESGCCTGTAMAFR